MTYLDTPTYEYIPKLPRVALWPLHLYRGTVTMIAGAGGTGKGLMGIHAAAVVTRGGLFPGEPEDTKRDRSPGSVLGVWPEDDPNEDIAWRLESALDGEGADKTLIYDMTETADGEPFSLNDGGNESVARLRAKIDELAGGNHPVKLVIIDPLLAVADTVNTNRQARKTLRPLMKMAKETGVAILVTHHTVKDGKIASSKGLTDTLRLVFTTRHDPMNNEVNVLAVEKSNNLGRIGDLRYVIRGAEQSPYIEWLQQDKTEERPQPDWRRQQAELDALAETERKYAEAQRQAELEAMTPRERALAELEDAKGMADKQVSRFAERTWK